MNSFAVARYAVQPRDEDDEVFGATDLAVPIVDGAPLFAILGGRWPGVPFEWLFGAPGRWPGPPLHTAWDRAVVLDGSCGVAECCGLVADITVHAETVVWDNFYCHGSATIPSDLRYEFVRTEYEAALDEARELLPVDWTQTPDTAY